MTHEALFLKVLEDQNKPEAEALRKRDRERQEADALMRDAAIYRTMPEDLRSRARDWKMEAFMCAVWSNAWMCGYLQASRDREAIPETGDGP